MERVIINPLTKEVQSQLRKKKYNFKARTDGDQAVAAAVAAKESKSLEERSHSAISTPTEAVSVASIPETDVPPKKALKTDESPVTSIIEAEILSIDDVTDQSKTLLQEEDLKPTHLRKEEIKRDFNFTAYPQKMKLVDFSNKVYIAPLTTVGNLPWRRVMKDFGADITCGEMAMSHNLVMGQASEWARIRRHPSEDCFGIQVAGGQPEHMTKIAKLLENETSSDFVDLNCGCPLDTICNR